MLVACLQQTCSKFDIHRSVHRNIIPNYSQQDATFLDLSILSHALHVSGGSSAHHQEHITVHTASGIVNQYCCWLLPWKRWNCRHAVLSDGQGTSSITRHSPGHLMCTRNVKVCHFRVLQNIHTQSYRSPFFRASS